MRTAALVGMDRRSLLGAKPQRWPRVSGEIFTEVMENRWDAARLVQAYGSDALDAFTLLMPLVCFTALNEAHTQHARQHLPALGRRRALRR